MTQIGKPIRKIEVIPEKAPKIPIKEPEKIPEKVGSND